MMLVVLAGCGRQVTGLDNPNAGTSVASGRTLIRFETAAPVDFSRFTYIIAINTTGSGQQPFALGYTSASYTNWSYAIIVGATAPGSISFPVVTQITQQPSASGGPVLRNIPYPTNFVTAPNLNISSVIAPGGFEITLNRCILDNPPASSTAATPAPISPNNVCPPFNYSQAVWNINLFTVDASNTVVDSLGNNGPQDPSVFFQINVSTQLDAVQRKTPLVTPPQTQQPAQIYGLEVISTP